MVNGVPRPHVQLKRRLPFQVLSCGAGKTGKTTVARLVAERMGIELLPSPAREVQAEFGLDREDRQFEMAGAERWKMQLEICRRGTERLKERLEDGRPFISDRAPIDWLAYSVERNAAEMLPSVLEAMELEAIQLMVRVAAVCYYPLGVFSPPKRDADARGFYSTDDFAARRHHDLLVQGYLHDWRDANGVPPFNLITMTARSIENRATHLIEQVKQIIRETVA